MKQVLRLSLPTLLALFTILLAGCTKKSDDFLLSGLSNEKQHKFQEALSDFNNAIRLDSNNAKAYLRRALIACRTGFTQPVGADLSKYIELTSPDLATAYIGRGLTNMLQGNIHESIKDLDNAIVVNPANI